MFAWELAAATDVGGDPDNAQWTPLGGSSLNATWRLVISGARYFVKVNDAARASMLAAEADGLRELGSAGAIRVPTPVTTGVDGAVAFLVLEWLELDSGGRGAVLGTALAQLHRTSAPRFGWHRDNTIGTISQENAWADDWATFLRDRRIAPQLALAARRRVVALPEVGVARRIGALAV